MQEQPIKRGRGQPRKRPTTTITIRIPKSLKPFLDELDNRNDFVLQLLLNTSEFKKYHHKKVFEESGGRSLFD